MKTLILALVGSSALLTFSACTTVEQRPEPSVHSTTTTTEESSIRRPVSASATTETRTIRSY